MSIRSVFVAGVLLLTGVAGMPATAGATCLYQCTAARVLADCSPAPTTMPEGDDLYLAGSCVTTCCAPPSEEHPNGSCTSEEGPLDTGGLRMVVADTVQTLPGVFEPLSRRCGDDSMALFRGELDPGMYQVIHSLDGSGSGMILTEIEVTMSTGCSTGGRAGTSAAALWGSLLVALTAISSRRRR